MPMKKFTLLSISLLMLSFLAFAQIKMIVHLNDAESIELYANSVDSVVIGYLSLHSNSRYDGQSVRAVLRK